MHARTFVGPTRDVGDAVREHERDLTDVNGVPLGERNPLPAAVSVAVLCGAEGALRVRNVPDASVLTSSAWNGDTTDRPRLTVQAGSRPNLYDRRPVSERETERVTGTHLEVWLCVGERARAVCRRRRRVALDGDESSDTANAQAIARTQAARNRDGRTVDPSAVRRTEIAK
jgi:hypothetical protein